METVYCEKCNKAIKGIKFQVEITCPYCGNELRIINKKKESANFDVAMSLSFSAEIIKSVYMIYYDLANEMAFKCQKSNYNSFVTKYSLGTVILSYTCIDSYLTNQIIVHKELKNITSEMSGELRNKFERYDIVNKIELLYLLYHKDNDTFNKGIEPLQSLEVLKQLRNTAIHYEPFPESGTSIEDISNVKIENLTNRAKHKFDFNKTQSTFLLGCFSKGAAKWSFNLIEEFIEWFCTEFKLSEPKFNRAHKLE